MIILSKPRKNHFIGHFDSTQTTTSATTNSANVITETDNALTSENTTIEKDVEADETLNLPLSNWIKLLFLIILLIF